MNHSSDSTAPSENAVIAAQADDVERDLTIAIDGNSQHMVQTISQSYPTTVADLWEACTDPERIERWFAPVSGELELCCRYQIEGNASGTIQECVPQQGTDAKKGDSLSVKLREQLAL